MSLVDTASPYALSGAIGLWMEDYTYDSGGTPYTRQQMRQELDLAGSGHIWDPRFLRFNIGLNLRETETWSSRGDSEYGLVGYNVNTSWFGSRSNPLTLNASRSRSTIADYAAPAYELETETVGGSWGFGSSVLGAVRLTANRIDNLATGDVVQRDETIENAALEASKRFKTAAGSASDMSYGYRYYNMTDHLDGSTRRQNHFFLSDRTTLSPTAHFTANATYYDRHDIWSGLADTDPLQVQDSRFFSGTVSLNLQADQKLRHNYTVSSSRNEINDNSTSTYSGRAGLDYVYNPRWQQHAAVTVRRTEIANDATAHVQHYAAESGVRYNNSFGEFLLHGGYTLALEQRDDDTVVDGDYTTVRHGMNVGYARSANQLWRDNAEYRLSLYTGLRDSVEHNIRYAVTSVPSVRDTLNGVAEVREYRESDSQGERQTQNQRLTLSWTRRLRAMSSLILSAAHTRNDGNSTFTTTIYDLAGDPVDSFTSSSSNSTSRSQFQARLTGVLQGAGHTQYGMLLRHEIEDYSTGDTLHRNVVEGDTTYTRGLWQFRLQYRLRETDQGEIDQYEQSIMLYGRRRFGARF